MAGPQGDLPEQQDRSAKLVGGILFRPGLSAARKEARKYILAHGLVKTTWQGITGQLPTGGLSEAVLSAMFTNPQLTAAVALLVIFFPLVLGLVLLTAADGILDWSQSWQIVFLAVLGLVSLIALVLLWSLAFRHTRGGVMRRIAGWGKADRLWWSILILLLPTLFAAWLSAVLINHHAVGVTGAAPGDESLPWAAFLTFIWYLADAVPVLGIPDTFGWESRFAFTSTFGKSLVFGYKLLLIFPFSFLLGALLASYFGGESGSRET